MGTFSLISTTCLRKMVLLIKKKCGIIYACFYVVRWFEKGQVITSNNIAVKYDDVF